MQFAVRRDFRRKSCASFDEHRWAAALDAFEL
jgi:hypothetical protein